MRGIRSCFLFILLWMAAPAQFAKLNLPGLKSEYIRSFARDRDRIYIGTTSGLYFKRKTENKFTQIFTLPPIYVTSIYPAENNIIWVASFEGVYKIDLSVNKILAHYTRTAQKDMDGTDSVPGLSSDNILFIAGNEETIFVGTDNWGVNLIDARLGIIKKERITSVDGLPSDSINHIHVTPAMLVVSTKKGIAWKGRWDDLWNTVDAKSPAYDVNVKQSVYINNRLFLGTATSGVMDFGIDSPDIVRVYDSAKGILPSDEIQGLAVDGKFLWVSLFSGGMARMNVPDAKWQTYPLKQDVTMDKIFIDGNWVYTGTDGDGVYAMRKAEPEITFFPEVSFSGKKMNLIGAIVSDAGYKPITAADIRYRDADVLGEFTSAGVTVSAQPAANVYHDPIAYIDFEKLNLIPKLWNYEVRLKITDEKGQGNEASAVFLYDSKKPTVKVLGFEQQSVQYTRDRSYAISGQVKDHRIRDFYYAKDGEKSIIEPDRRGNFTFSVPLNKMTNNIEINAVDFCQNITKKGLTVIFDEKPPQVLKNEGLYTISEDAKTVSFEYAEDNLLKATYKDVENPIPKEFMMDPNQKRISADFEQEQKDRTYTVELIDKAGNKTSFQIKVTKNDNKPIISIQDAMNDVETDLDKFKLKGMVKAKLEPLTVLLFDNTNSVELKFNAQTKVFEAELSLTRYNNVFTIRAEAGVGDQSAASEKTLTIRCLKYPPDSTDNVQTTPEGDADMAARIKALQAEVERLKKRGGVTVRAGSDFYTSKAALKVVKYENTTLPELAKKYTGSEKFAEVIELININMRSEIKQDRKIVVPNRVMVDMLLGDEASLSRELVQACSYALYTANGKGAAYFKKQIENNKDIFDEQVSITASGREVLIRPKADARDGVRYQSISLKLLEDGMLSIQFN